ncbi:chromosome segregation in meiosis- protein [Emydomyces testavorans]|uniref:Chromosome segregation in meiosis protein n=1 Tax=Emydomyces testavorans TaxID=2070801 RepID=A0AAF0DIQ7_9EURO|nr:chromosome segregation in meiosis- protein [Emydomyces testavorans]
MANTAIDDLFNYDAGIEDLLRDPEEENNNTNQDTSRTAAGKTGSKSDDLGIDDVIQITKKRAPPVKLDESRLLSQAGIPKLRKSAKTKLKFKGKGHEFSDIARLLNFYQLWLDDLYPRAKFADGLTILEKLGHSKRMQVMRREWIDEGKPGRNISYDSSNTTTNDHRSGNTSIEETVPSIFPQTSSQQNGPDSNPLAENPTAPPEPVIPSIFGDGQRTTSNQDSVDDDLFVPSGGRMDIDPAGGGPPDIPEEDDDLEALLAEEHTARNAPETAETTKPNASAPEEEDDLDALLAEAENISANAPENARRESSRQTADDFEDELQFMNEFGL